MAVHLHALPGSFASLLSLLSFIGATGCRPASSAPAPRAPVPGIRPGDAVSLRPGAARPAPRPSGPISLPSDARERYLLGASPLPVPSGDLFVHLELEPLRRGAGGARITRALWQGLRVESAGGALLGGYLRRCGLDSPRTARAVSLVQPLEGRPGSDRVVVLWGLLGARRLVACLGDAVVADGGSAVVLIAGGDTGLALDRAASDLHLDVLALDGETLLVASGPDYRLAVRSLVGAPRGSGGSGRPVAPVVAQPLYQQAVAGAPKGTVLLALAPRFPRALPHLGLPSDVPRNVLEGHLLLRLTPTGLALSVHLRVKGPGRAARWARRIPGRLGRLFPFVPVVERPFLAKARPSAAADTLRLDLEVPRTELPAFGRAASRWLPW